ncbi:MAG: hypothetical protein ACI31S_04345 [Bacilli bacterium]
MIRAFFFLVGFGLMVIGCSFIILYINLMSMGYNFLNYVNFIIRRIECYYSIIGLIIMILSITIKGDKKDEFYL